MTKNSNENCCRCTEACVLNMRPISQLCKLSPQFHLLSCRYIKLIGFCHSMCEVCCVFRPYNFSKLTISHLFGLRTSEKRNKSFMFICPLKNHHRIVLSDLSPGRSKLFTATHKFHIRTMVGWKAIQKKHNSNRFVPIDWLTDCWWFRIKHRHWVSNAN